MLWQKSCPRCHRGDLILENGLGEYRIHCLQCGHDLNPKQEEQLKHPLKRVGAQWLSRTEGGICLCTYGVPQGSRNSEIFCRHLFHIYRLNKVCNSFIFTSILVGLPCGHVRLFSVFSKSSNNCLLCFCDKASPALTAARHAKYASIL